MGPAIWFVDDLNTAFAAGGFPGALWDEGYQEPPAGLRESLTAQLTAVQYGARSRCVVIAGTLLADPYTGRRIEFRKAAAAKVQIDHLYPLARAWDIGAARWPLQRRVEFANDQAANLLAVDGPANTSKNDEGPGEWLPLNRSYRCTYVLRYLQVAASTHCRSPQPTATRPRRSPELARELSRASSVGPG